MDSVSLHPPRTMILIGILASMLITITHSAPLAFAAYERKGLSTTSRQPKVLLVVGRRLPKTQDEMLDDNNDPNSTLLRNKKLGSLSVVNSLDVLRERVLLELARRKALQDQRQINENRRYLDSIGKRSIPKYTRMQRQTESREQSIGSERIPERTEDWVEVDDSAFREGQDDQMQRVQANELRLL